MHNSSTEDKTLQQNYERSARTGSQSFPGNSRNVEHCIKGIFLKQIDIKKQPSILRTL